VPYESLGSEDKAVIDRNRAVDGWDRTHDAFGIAVRERSLKARAEAAQIALGVDGLENLGAP
jgi:hypothetical protein